MLLDKIMYNKTNVRQPRTNNSGWKNKKSTAKPRSNNNNFRGSRGRKFAGDKIDINKFINQAEAIGATPKFVPQYSFADLNIHPELKKSIAKRGYINPTPIQDQAIPVILAAQDIIGLANTGTGKTGAFLIPMIHKMLNNPAEKVLIVTPTRELAIQIQEEFVALTQQLKLYSTVVVGGAGIQGQIVNLRKQPNVVIGTPGRLKDLISRKVLNLSFFNNVVLDEADRMLDMGFINDVKLLLSLVARKRQVLLFSATFNKEIEDLVGQFLNNPKRVSIKTGETSKQVEQNIVRVSINEDKIEVLHNMLIQTHFEKVLVFTRTKHGADNLSKKLYQRGLKSEAIHGNKSHGKRQRALKLFKENDVSILIATDVAARGLDIPNVSHVINFDVPATYEDYIHRIGRTGRADKRGTALTFIN
ncbi:MAG: DEAD/DEAH box helicase [Candidatus Moraniibacteriota bacterium]